MDIICTKTCTLTLTFYPVTWKLIGNIYYLCILSSKWVKRYWADNPWSTDRLNDCQVQNKMPFFFQRVHYYIRWRNSLREETFNRLLSCFVVKKIFVRFHARAVLWNLWVSEADWNKKRVTKIRQQEQSNKSIHMYRIFIGG